MILVTSASGKTGEAVVTSLAHGHEPVRALVRKASQEQVLRNLGAQEVMAGDLRDQVFIAGTFQGIRAVYHICPNMSPDEILIAEIAIAAAEAAGTEHFVYHSVLHPQVEAMPHHWLKMRVEERLFTAKIPFTILQPAAYMQNVFAHWESITRQGIYPVPYAEQARLSIVDLSDLAEVAARILTEGGHAGAIYELSGPEPLSQTEVAEVLCQGLGKPVKVQVQDRAEWEKRARLTNMSAYAVDTLLKMFEYYERNGLVGNSKVLETLLGRAPHRFAQVVDRMIRGG